MKKPAIMGALVLIGLGVALGATVFRTDIAQATGLDKPAQNVVVKNTPAQAVPVREQNLDGGNIKVHEQGTAAVRAANEEVSVSGHTHSPNNGFCEIEDFYTVPDGKTLVIEYLAASAQVSDTFQTWGGEAWIQPTTGDVWELPFVFPAQLQIRGGFLDSSQAVHYAVPAGTTLWFRSQFANGNANPTGCTVDVTMGGYLQPSP